MSLLGSSLAPSIARIKNERGGISGAGICLASSFVLTCAHVIDDVQRQSDSVLVKIDFPMVEGSPQFSAKVLCREPLADGHRLDIALLELDRPLAANRPVPLERRDDYYGHAVTAMGFSAGNDPGIWADGRVIARIGTGQIQIGSVAITGPFFEPGFSGTAVWDKDIEAIIGIVASVKADKGLRTAFFISLADAAEAIPELADVIEAAGPALPTMAERAWDARARQLLSCSSPIPMVGQANPYDLGVSPSKYSGQPKRSDPYVRRDIDAKLEEAIVRYPFVLVVGPAMSGKSRSSYEAIRRVYPNARLIVPRSSKPRVFEQLDELLPPSAFGNEQIIVWLDDLEGYLGSAGLDADHLRRWEARSPSVKVVATIRSDSRQSAKETEFAGTRHIVERAYSVLLSPTLSRKEHLTASEIYPEETFIGGIGETLSAARELLAKFDDNQFTFPVGYAIVSAAANWKRCGMNRALSRVELKLATDVMLRSEGVPLTLNEDDFDAGIRWATDPIATHVALVNRLREGSAGYQAVDLIESQLDEREVEIPLDFWQELTELSTPTEAAYIGISAWRRSITSAAADALEKGIRAPDPEDAHRAKLGYMLVLSRQAKLKEVRAIYEELKNQDSDNLAPTLNMAAVLSNVGLKEEAKNLLVAAAGSSKPIIAAVANVNLADILASQGDSPSAVKSLERARSLKSTEAEPLITIRLAELSRK